MAPLVGELADRYSVATVLWTVAFIPLVALPLILMFPRRRETPP